MAVKPVLSQSAWQASYVAQQKKSNPKAISQVYNPTTLNKLYKQYVNNYNKTVAASNLKQTTAKKIADGGVIPGTSNILLPTTPANKSVFDNSFGAAAADGSSAMSALQNQGYTTTSAALLTTGALPSGTNLGLDANGNPEKYAWTGNALSTTEARQGLGSDWYKRYLASVDSSITQKATITENLANARIYDPTANSQAQDAAFRSNDPTNINKYYVQPLDVEAANVRARTNPLMAQAPTLAAAAARFGTGSVVSGSSALGR